MKFICPLIVVSDMQRARNFYENILCQKVKFDFVENVTYHGDFAIHLKSHFQQLIDQKEISCGGNNFELYFEFDDVEQKVHELIESGIEFVHELREQPWRQRVVRFYDPDKHIIEIGESMEYLSFRLSEEGLAPEQIASKIMMPVDFVEISILNFSK